MLSLGAQDCWATSTCTAPRRSRRRVSSGRRSRSSRVTRRCRLLIKGRMPSGEECQFNNLFSAANQLLFLFCCYFCYTPSFANSQYYYCICRYLYENALIHGRLGLLFGSWDKRESEGARLVHDAQAVLKTTPQFPSSIQLSATFQYPVLGL